MYTDNISLMIFLIQGTLPTKIGEETIGEVCLQGFKNNCSETWKIDIRYCSGNYLVYNLVTSVSPNSGYCFGKYLKCIFKNLIIRQFLKPIYELTVIPTNHNTSQTIAYENVRSKNIPFNLTVE